MNNAPNAVASRNDSENAGSHWYGIENGRVVPLYKEGGTFTKREARKLLKEGKAVLPSVTSYFKQLHKEQLVNWKMEQAVIATTKLVRAEYGTEEQWVDAALVYANNASKGAADLGTRIHKAIEHGLEGGEYEAEMDVYVRPVLDRLDSEGFITEAQEICVADPIVGYAGRCDLLGQYAEEGIPTVIDFKSRKTTPGRPARGYPTDLVQAICYGRAHFGAGYVGRGHAENYIISTTEPGRVDLIRHDPEEFTAAWEAFVGLTAVWRFFEKFDPRLT